MWRRKRSEGPCLNHLFFLPDKRGEGRERSRGRFLRDWKGGDGLRILTNGPSLLVCKEEGREEEEERGLNDLSCG